MVISKSMSRSLANLESTISQAEKELKRIPGSSQTSICADDRDDHYSEIVFEHGKLRLCSYDFVPMNGSGDPCERIEDVVLRELPVSRRIEAAGLIPEFISLAVAAESEVEQQAIDATERIEHALAELNRTRRSVPIISEMYEQLAEQSVSIQKASQDTSESRFRKTWIELSELGTCDSIDGAEYRRVFSEWKTAGMPEGADKDFIITRME